MTSPIDKHRLADRIRNGSADGPARTRAGERFARGRLVAAARKGEGQQRGTSIPEGNETLLSSRELVGALKLRTYSNLTIFDIDGVPQVAMLPVPARVPSLVETIVTTHTILELTEELTQSIVAAGAMDGTPLVEPSSDWGPTPVGTILPRFGLGMPISRGVLDDEDQVASLLERRIRLGFTLGLENQILTAPAGDPSGPGILNVTGTSSLSKGGSDVYRLDTIARGVQTVQDAGWYLDGLQVVAHPTTLEAIRTEKDTVGHYAFRPQAVTPDVEAWVPSTELPAGTAIVGDFLNGAALFIKDGLTISVATNHLDFMIRDMLEWVLATRAYSWIRNPSAFCLCEGL